MLDAILPPDLRGAACLPEAPLWPEELVLVAGVVESRRRDVVLGRTCARAALAALGAPVGAVPADRDHVPRWPPGVVGSITHTREYAAAVVAWESRYRGIGLDAEHRARVKPELMHLIATPRELGWIAAHPEPALARALVFSAKEAAYKAQFPSTRQFLDFLEAEVTFAAATFRVAFRAGSLAAALPPLDGRFTASAAHVVTLALVPRE